MLLHSFPLVCLPVVQLACECQCHTQGWTANFAHCRQHQRERCVGCKHDISIYQVNLELRSRHFDWRERAAQVWSSSVEWGRGRWDSSEWRWFDLCRCWLNCLILGLFFNSPWRIDPSGPGILLKGKSANSFTACDYERNMLMATCL